MKKLKIFIIYLLAAVLVFSSGFLAAAETPDENVIDQLVETEKTATFTSFLQVMSIAE